MISTQFDIISPGYDKSIFYLAVAHASAFNTAHQTF